MIDSIELLNWKTHKHTVMHFQKGVNVLIGIMGSGKSSIMDAISFALFGTFPAIMHKRVGVKELIMKRPNECDSAEVKLTFSIGKDVYKVTRVIHKRNPTTSKLERNGAYLQTQSERVNDEIASLLKMDYDTFSRAVYSEQNMIDYFLELPKSERKRQIDQMLGLDSFARAEENCISLVNSFRSEIKSCEESLAGYNLASMKLDLQKITNERNERESEMHLMANQASIISQQIKDISRHIAELKEMQSKKQKLAHEAVSAKSRIETLSSELARIDEKEDIENIKSQFDALKKSLAEKENRKKAAKAELLAAADKLSNAVAERKSVFLQREEAFKANEALKKMPLDIIDAKIERAREEGDANLKKLAVFQAQLEETSNAILELKKADTKCPVCDRELSEQSKEALISQKSAAIISIKAEIGACNNYISHSQEELRRFRSMRDNAILNERVSKKLVQFDDKLAQIDNIIPTHRAMHKSIGENIEAIEKEIDSLKDIASALSSRLERAQVRNRYIEELSRLSSLLTKIELESASIIIDEHSIELNNKSLVEKSKALGELESKAGGIEKLIANIDAQIKEKAMAISRVEQIEEKLDKNRSILSNLNKFKNAITDAQSALRLRLISTINSTMQGVWTQIYPYGDYISVRLLAGPDDYVLQSASGVDVGGAMIWQDIQGIASGGERSIASLAMRISISTVIVPNLKWLILDEPTHNIDENGISRITGVLGEALPNIVEQVFVITHDSSMKNIANAKVYQLDRNKALHEPTITSEI